MTKKVLYVILPIALLFVAGVYLYTRNPSLEEPEFAEADWYAESAIESVIMMPEGRGTNSGPFIITSEEQFDYFLSANPPGESRQIYFYQVTNDVEPLRESCDYLTFAEIVFVNMNNDEVVGDGVFIVNIEPVATSDPPHRGFGSFSINIRVPDGYVGMSSAFGMPREIRYVTFGSVGYQEIPPSGWGTPPIRPGRNPVRVRERLSINLRRANGETRHIFLNRNPYGIATLTLPVGYSFNGHREILVSEAGWWEVGEWENGDILTHWERMPQIPIFRSGSTVDIEAL